MASGSFTVPRHSWTWRRHCSDIDVITHNFPCDGCAPPFPTLELRIAPRPRFCDIIVFTLFIPPPTGSTRPKRDAGIYTQHDTINYNSAAHALQHSIMDPMESMSSAPVPKDFDAEEAVNMEEVR